MTKYSLECEFQENPKLCEKGLKATWELISKWIWQIIISTFNDFMDPIIWKNQKNYKSSSDVWPCQIKLELSKKRHDVLSIKIDHVFLIENIPIPKMLPIDHLHNSSYLKDSEKSRSNQDWHEMLPKELFLQWALMKDEKLVSIISLKCLPVNGRTI